MDKYHFRFCESRESSSCNLLHYLSFYNLFFLTFLILKYHSNLPNAVNELKEDRGSVRVVVLVVPVPDPVVKLVAVAEPLLLNQHLKPFQSSVVGVE